MRLSPRSPTTVNGQGDPILGSQSQEEQSHTQHGEADHPGKEPWARCFPLLCAPHGPCNYAGDRYDEKDVPLRSNRFTVS